MGVLAHFLYSGFLEVANGVFSRKPKCLKDKAPYISMSERQKLIRELYGTTTEDVRALLEYKKQLWEARLEQDFASFGAQRTILLTLMS